MLTIDATDPKSGHRGVQGRGGPGREARSAEPARGASRCRGGRQLMDLRLIPTPSRPRRARRARRLLGARRAAGTAASATGPEGNTAAAAATTRASAGTCCCRRCTRSRSAIGWISPGALNYDLPAARRAAGRRLRRRDVLRAARDSSRARRASSTSATTSPAAARLAELCARAEAALRSGEGEPRTADRATWLPQPVPRPVRPGARGAGQRRGRSSRSSAVRPPTTAAGRARRALAASAPAADPPRCPQAGRRRRCSCCAGSAASIRDSLDAYRAARRLRGAARGPSSSGPDGCRSARSGLEARWAAAAPRSRPGEVGGGRPAAGAAALPRLQRRRVRARHVQGPGAAWRTTRSRWSRR